VTIDAIWRSSSLRVKISGTFVSGSNNGLSDLITLPCVRSDAIAEWCLRRGRSNMVDLYGYSLITIFLLGLVVIWGAGEIAWQLGARCGGRGGDNFSTLESATLGLLALIIGFTFAMALSRFEARRDAIVNEANAIGTTALRARLLPQPHRTETLNLLREYVQIRLDIIENGLSLAELKAIVDRSNAIQEALWQQARQWPQTTIAWYRRGSLSSRSTR
jgi:hypothetical protein